VIKPSYGDQDPIAALATVLGESALAIIRTSGAGTGRNLSSIGLVASVFSKPRSLAQAPGNSIVHGWIIDPVSKKKIDDVLVSVYRSPKSYTGEDGADITCHGGIAAVKAVMAVLKTAGFRDALPGEFTFRSFMNGKQDLTRAESVMEIVSAKTNSAREQAVRRLSGALEKEIGCIKKILVDVLAGAEIYLDYSEDEFDGSAEAEGKLPDRDLAESAAARLANISQLWRYERIYADGVLAVLAGRPNAGKSSLFNYLLREERSIVAGTPGTTRDWIEAVISIEDIPVRLADTAGLRDIGAADAGGEVERIGIERSFELLEKADLVLYVVDGSEGMTSEDRVFLDSMREKPVIVIWNKCDIAAPPPDWPADFPAVSAKTGEGIPALLRQTAELFLDKKVPRDSSQTGPGTARQKELVDAALASVNEALALADRGEPLDLIAPLFRTAVNCLGEITGEVTGAEILETMFSRFCVGK